MTIFCGLLLLQDDDHVIVLSTTASHDSDKSLLAQPHKTIATYYDFFNTLNISSTDVTLCVEEKRFDGKIQSDIDSALAAKVKGTPHSYVMIDDALYEIPGAYEEKGMREFFDDLLAQKTPRATDISDKTTVTPVSADDRIIGPDNARITIITYSDLDCPHCKKFHAAITNIQPDYANTIRLVFRHMPVVASHPDARIKAEIAECIGLLWGNEGFWAFIDYALSR